MLISILFHENGAEYHAMFRMDKADFDYLLNLVSSLKAKQGTLLRTSRPISARERLEVTANTARGNGCSVHTTRVHGPCNRVGNKKLS